ncbi:conserved protein, unknown function [Hepatocystis sp. ex Piliocolobus tephrosceles]|nr:conserved protein, unknown function [Hepatocystis sp. ex Piliocolobus tephrosceles]
MASFLRNRNTSSTANDSSHSKTYENETEKEAKLVNKNVPQKDNKIKITFQYIKYIINNKIQGKYKYSFLVGLFIVFLIFSGFFQLMLRVYHTRFYNFKYIDENNIDELKELFFSNKPYMVYCKNSKNESIHPVINQSSNNFPDILNIAIINCKTVLPSKKTVYERFNIDESTKAFIICYGKKPKPINLNIMNDKKKLLAFIRKTLIFSVPFFTKFPQFQTKCINKNKKCIIFITSLNLNKSIKYNYINDIFINNKFFDINPLIVDNRKFLVKLSDDIFKDYSKKKDIHVLCLFNEAGTESETDTQDQTQDENVKPVYYGYFYKHDFDNFKDLSSFVSSCIKATSKTEEVVRLTDIPQIKYRASKKKIEG